MPSDSKSSHGLWSGELKTDIHIVLFCNELGKKEYKISKVKPLKCLFHITCKKWNLYMNGSKFMTRA
jgi:hypothetical protein